jgi:hypothetical protein
MWKGEPGLLVLCLTFLRFTYSTPSLEFHLVAGGEELFQESGLMSHNTQASRQSSMAASSRDRSTERQRTHISVPSSDSSSESEPSPLTGVIQLHVNTDVHSSPSYSTFSPSIAEGDVKPEPRSPVSSSLASPTLVQPTYSPSHFQDVAPTHTSVRLTRLQVWADGLDPFTVEVDSLTSPPKPYSRVMLRLKLCITPVSDPNLPSSLDGFCGAIMLSQPWSTSGKCFTRVFAANTCISKELDYLRPTNQNLTAMLPDSWLTKSRWLEASEPSSYNTLFPARSGSKLFITASRTSITQQIIVDDEVIAFIVYDLDRGMDSNAGPSVELTGFQKYAGNKDNESSAPTTVSTSSYHSSSNGESSRFAPVSSHAQIQQTSASDTSHNRSSYHGM